MAKLAAAIVPPFSLYAMARSNLQGSVRISISMTPEQRDRDTCIQFLLGFAAEGYLKAYLAFDGVNEIQLKAIGHDLVKAYERALARGLPIQDLYQLRFVIETLSLPHRRNFYRYLPNNPDGSEKQFELVRPLLAFESLKLLDRAVFPFLLPEINRELERQGRPLLAEWPGVDGLP